MSPSSSIPFPSIANSSSRPSLLAKWNRGARISISSKSVSNVTISAPLPLGSAVRRNSLLPKPSKKRTLKEIMTNENDSADAERSRACVRQRMDSNATIQGADDSHSPLQGQHEAVADSKAKKPRDDDSAQAKPGQAKKALKALKNRLKIPTGLSTRGRTEEQVAHKEASALASPGNAMGVSQASGQDLTISSPKLASREREPVTPHPDTEEKDDKVSQVTHDQSSSKPQDLHRGGSKPKAVHFSVPPAKIKDSQGIDNWALDTSVTKAKSMPPPLQPRNANISHISTAPLRAVPTKHLFTEAKRIDPESPQGKALRKNVVFKAVNLSPDQLQFAIAFYAPPHFEIWDMQDDICLAWPAELRLKTTDPDRWNFIPLITPEISRVELRCHTKNYCEDGDHTRYPYTVCDSDSWYSVSFTGAVCAQGRTSMMSPEAGIHITSEWTRTYTRRSIPELSSGDAKLLERGRKPSRMPGERGWAMKFWIPIPTNLFVKRETRSFVVESKIWLADDERCIPEEDKALTAVTEMTISHLRKEREMA